jgi:HPt (histidine-containing phosphotransfer) domain-containing protein
MTQPALQSTAVAREILDMVAIGEVRAMMKEKFAEILGYFLEDSVMYVQQIAQGCAAGKAEAIVLPAHTLKSSAKQMGAMRLAEHARHIEFAARETARNGTEISHIAHEIDQLHLVFDEAKHALEQVR